MPPDSQKDSVTVEVRWGAADDLPTLFANQMLVSHAGGGEFYLLFGELTPPLVPDLKDAWDKGLIPKVFEIKPVVKLVLSPDAMKSIGKAITDNLAKYEKGRAESQEES